MPANMNLSFAGCGFLGIYHVGVAVCFKKYAPHLLLDKISGASAGAIAACALLCDLPIGEHVTDILKVVKEARTKALGPFSPSFNIHNLLLDSLKKILPEDAHQRVNGKLHISLTRVYDGKNVIVSQFTSKQDLLQALLASCFVPVFSGMLPPRFRGIRYMDGGFSDNLPVLDENTITVSPFCGESDICPRDASSQLFHVNVANTSIELSRQNIYRFTKILFPPKPEVLASMCKQGFDDALRFLHRNNLINCTRCLSVNSTFTISDSLAESFEYDPHCEDCKNHRQEALMANLPDTVLTIFQDAIDSANKGLMNWVFRHRGMKILSYLSLPYTVPADIVYATFTNLIGSTVETRSYQMRVVGNMIVCPEEHYCTLHRNKRSRLAANAPEVKMNLRQASQFVLNQLALLFQHMNKTTWQLTAKISCQLAINQCGSVDYHDYDYDSSSDSIKSLRSNMNLNLNLNSDRDLDEYVVSKPLSRWSSTELPLDNDTFEHILQVTTHHEAVMAFYYMDEQNQVKLTEVFDVTDADSSGMLSPEERENNMFLEFDDDFEDPLANTWTSQLSLNGSTTNISEISFEEQDDDYPELEPANIFSDPESEWIGEESHTSDLEQDKCLTMCYMPEQSLPESDQLVINTSKSTPRKQQPIFED